MTWKTNNGVLTWAVVGKKSGKVLHDMQGHYAIYTHCSDAKKDCPAHGQVRRVRIRVDALSSGP